MWKFLAEVVSPIKKVRLTLAARRYARHLRSQLRHAYGGGDEYTAAQIRAAVQKCRLPVRYIKLGYAAFMTEEAFRALVLKTGKSAAESLHRGGRQPVAVVIA